MAARAVALVAALCLLAGCTPDPSPPDVAATSGRPASVVPTTATTPTGTPSATASADESAPSSTATPPKLIVLSGTSIGGRPLGHAELKSVDPMLVERLGEAKVGQPQLCRAGTRDATAVVDHSWKGLTVRYASTGGAAVAIAWTVDPARVPDGFELVDGLPWAPTFATLKAMPGVRLSTDAGRARASLTSQGITWSGPAGSKRPDTVAGGTDLSCD